MGAKKFCHWCQSVREDVASDTLWPTCADCAKELEMSGLTTGEFQDIREEGAAGAVGATNSNTTLSDEVIEAMVGWSDTIPQGPEDLQKPITYVLTSHGVREFRRTPFGMVVEACDAPLGRVPHTLPHPPSFNVFLTIPRLPFAHYAQIVSFFRAVYNRHKTEALVRVFYSREGGEWLLHVPQQRVSHAGVHVSTSEDFDMSGQLIHAFDIHSHCNFSPFFSSTDSEDERKAVRIYGVIGHLLHDVPASNWRVWTGKRFTDLLVGDVIEAPTEALTVTVDIMKHLHLATGKSEAGKHLVPLVNPFNVAFPDGWMKQLTVEGAGSGVSIRDFRGQGGKWWDEQPHNKVTTWDHNSTITIPGDQPDPDRPHCRVASVQADTIITMAKQAALVNTTKLVYVVRADGKVVRVKNDGSLVETAMTPAGLARQQLRDTQKRVMVYGIIASGGKEKS